MIANEGVIIWSTRKMAAYMVISKGSARQRLKCRSMPRSFLFTVGILELFCHVPLVLYTIHQGPRQHFHGPHDAVFFFSVNIDKEKCWSGCHYALHTNRTHLKYFANLFWTFGGVLILWDYFRCNMQANRNAKLQDNIYTIGLDSDLDKHTTLLDCQCYNQYSTMMGG
ncbi:hypothetical protein ACJX0J_020069 [Zea mays]